MDEVEHVQRESAQHKDIHSVGMWKENHDKQGDTINYEIQKYADKYAIC